MKVLVAISTVADGSMLNRSQPDHPQVTTNRQSWLAKYNLTLDQSTRLSVIYEGDDFCRYKQVGPAEFGGGMTGAPLEATDAIVTRTPGQVLFLPIADCVGTTIFDPEHEVLMLSHLGRHSLEQDGGYKSIKFLVDHYGSNPAKLQLWLAPAPGKKNYPVFSMNNRGLKEIAFEQLERAGVKHQNISDDSADTTRDKNYFSHSEFLKGNQAEDGRFAMIAVMQQK